MACRIRIAVKLFFGPKVIGVCPFFIRVDCTLFPYRYLFFWPEKSIPFFEPASSSTLVLHPVLHSQPSLKSYPCAFTKVLLEPFRLIRSVEMAIGTTNSFKRTTALLEMNARRVHVGDMHQDFGIAHSG